MFFFLMDAHNARRLKNVNGQRLDKHCITRAHRTGKLSRSCVSIAFRAHAHPDALRRITSAAIMQSFT